MKTKITMVKTIGFLGLPAALVSCAAINQTLPNADPGLNRPSAVSSFAGLSKISGPDADPASAIASLPKISKKTEETYLSFASIFLKAAVSTRRSDVSANFSLMDAFYDLGIDANISEGEGQKNILAYFGGSTLNEINTAAKELRPLLAVVDSGTESQKKGSVLLGTLFVGRALSVDGSRADIAQILKEDYGVYVYHDDPVVANVNFFLDEKTPKDYFTPLLMDKDDELPPADSLMAAKTALSLSAFDYIAQSSLGKVNRNAYVKKAQTLQYTASDGAVSTVPFGYDGYEGMVYEGDGFTASETSLGVTLFKPNAGTNPWGFASKMADAGVLHDGERRDITSLIPYFRTKTKMDSISLGTYQEGVFSAFVKGVEPSAAFSLFQKNDAAYSPEGFASRSMTYTTNYVSSSTYDAYLLTLDSPFAYRTDLSVALNEGGDASLPLSVGIVEIPNYSD